MPRIDTHIHLWDNMRFDYPWRQSGSFTELPDTYQLGDAISEYSHAETAFIAVQAEVNHTNDPVDETAWIQNMVDEHPNGNRTSGFVAYANLADTIIALTLERH
ncbi:hypothetical protein SAMN05444358_1011725 [Ruegeria halocynthiae]|uniref:Amidohydrolase n=1 Tax=Ruegeria halocynthiae TaxID=985054 RepID=A0A1H2WAI6_9RHOB|nr:hypothetical protein [Ruegeria halocynthiae]SDW77537.1 hypothetical protein SAMN05444358_1011725 [Ruegeria halocynthiae]